MSPFWRLSSKAFGSRPGLAVRSTGACSPIGITWELVRACPTAVLADLTSGAVENLPILTRMSWLFARIRSADTRLRPASSLPYASPGREHRTGSRVGTEHDLTDTGVIDRRRDFSMLTMSSITPNGTGFDHLVQRRRAPGRTQ
jgi:hypothetical protein